MKMNYEQLRNKLLEIKKTIDNEIKNKGISSDLLRYENKLDSIWEEIYSSTVNEQNKRFITFNYYAPKTYILLAKGYKFEAVNSFCCAISNYVQYLNYIDNPNFNRWTLEYYRSLSLHLVNSNIELFGNAPIRNVKEILNSLKDTISIKLKHPNFKKDVDRVLSNFLFSLVAKSSSDTKSSGIYSNQHLEISKKIKQLTLHFAKDDDMINGIVKSLEFNLARKELYYYLRQLVPKEGRDIDRTSIYENIKDIIKEMKTVARDEIKFFKKLTDDVEEDISFKKFLAEIDELSSKYYESLWIKKDLIEAFKKLESIFSKIRNNWQKIITPDIFSHFTQEFVFLNNYFKLLLLKRDFEKFGESLAEKEWQKEVAIRVRDSLNKIATEFFKYGILSSLHRKLLIVEEASSGKFVEFVVFYILREIILNKNKVELKNIIKNIPNQSIRDFLSILNEVKDISQIQWNYKISNKSSDIDILISAKYVVFFKTGILDSKDRNKILEEIELAQHLNSKRIYQIIDIAKNLDIVRKLSNKYPNVNLIDIGEFLRTLLDIAKNKKISLELTKSSVLSYAGFYTGG